jgi:hypothetical protein
MYLINRLGPVRTDINLKKISVADPYSMQTHPDLGADPIFETENQPHFVALHKHNLNYFFRFYDHLAFLYPEPLIHLNPDPIQIRNKKYL